MDSRSWTRLLRFASAPALVALSACAAGTAVYEIRDDVLDLPDRIGIRRSTGRWVLEGPDGRELVDGTALAQSQFGATLLNPIDDRFVALYGAPSPEVWPGDRKRREAQTWVATAEDLERYRNWVGDEKQVWLTGSVVEINEGFGWESIRVGDHEYPRAWRSESWFRFDGEAGLPQWHWRARCWWVEDVGFVRVEWLAPDGKRVAFLRQP